MNVQIGVMIEPRLPVRPNSLSRPSASPLWVPDVWGYDALNRARLPRRHDIHDSMGYLHRPTRLAHTGSAAGQQHVGDLAHQHEVWLAG
ncbi:hypothetical protein ACTWPB_19340 [Nocardia sp. IBHARD005]|uniref:hypothetical protein n=1 Tax=Nocardia sp. IBHARD005 TaxID=3457765 RepID=UPI00405A2551